MSQTRVEFDITGILRFVGHEVVERAETDVGPIYVHHLEGRLHGVSECHVEREIRVECPMFDGTLRVLDSEGRVRSNGEYVLRDGARKGGILTTWQPELHTFVDVEGMRTDDLKKLRDRVNEAIYDRERER